MPYIGKSPEFGIRQRYYFTATGGETSLSGTDDNGLTLAFSDGTYVDVMLNGITLVAGTDYNTTTANTISGLAALTASDIVEIVVYDVFSVANTVPSTGGTYTGAVSYSAATTYNGDVTYTKALQGNTQSISHSSNTTLTLDFDTYQNFIITMSGNITTLSNPSTEAAGQSGFIVFIQDGTGGRTLDALDTDYETVNAGGITLSTAASTTDVVPYIVVSSGRILLGNIQKAFA